MGKSKRGTRLTIGELIKSRDEGLLRSMVPVFLMFQAMENLQATRLNILHGYFSVANACLRNVVEALRWGNTAAESAEVAREWLRNGDYGKPKNFVLAPPVQEIMKLFGRLSKAGSHPLAIARTYSAWAKSEARTFLDDEVYIGVSAHFWISLIKFLQTSCFSWWVSLTQSCWKTHSCKGKLMG